ncbi:MAG: hypothetical protein ABIF77_08890 [bacterium]
MSIQTSLDAGTGVRCHKVVGDLSFAELRSELGLLYQQPGFEVDTHVLWDLREGNLAGFSAEEIRQLADFVSGNWGKSGRSRAALVVAQEVDFGLSRMYSALLDTRTKSQVRVFRDPELALDWLMAR